MQPTHLLLLAAMTAIASTAFVVEGCSSDTSSTPIATAKDASTTRDTGATPDSGDITPPDSGDTTPDSGSGDSATTQTAKATLASVGDSGTTGTGSFTDNNGTITFSVTIQNSTPGKHGLHVHQGTDCAAPGPHYGPDGGPYHGEYSINIDDAGAGTLSVPATDVTVTGGMYPVTGHALVFHAAPVPDAGGPPPRAACGVLQ